VLISIIALTNYLVLGLVRRTFVFYSTLEDTIIVEERMQRRSDSPETDMRRYTEEVLLGPVSQNAALLFPRETVLESLIFRDGVVYADFSETEALFDNMIGEKGVFLVFLTLNQGIRRNFSSVKDVKFFIGGKEIFFTEFREIFEDFADNTIKPVNGS
jgi:spore germination protein GerM